MTGDGILKVRDDRDAMAIRDWWSNEVPPGYQNTTLESLPNKLVSAGVLKLKRWARGDSEESHELSYRGLYFFGGSGSGKTRTAYLLLAQNAGNYWEEKPWLIRGPQFAREVVERTRPGGSGDFQAWFDGLCNCEMVAIDELDKIRWSPRVESEFFELVERRCSDGHPTIYTANLTPEQVCASMKPNYGPATLRRIQEFSDPINFNTTLE